MVLAPEYQYSRTLGTYLRFTVEACRGDRRLAGRLQSKLEEMEGVWLASANYRTGNVLILCEQQGIDQEQLAARLPVFERPAETQSRFTRMPAEQSSPLPQDMTVTSTAR